MIMGMGDPTADNPIPSVPGTVYLVGAGPGDPGLITVRGMDLLCNADVVVYDALANPALLKSVREDAELIAVGKRAKRHTMTQDDINALLAEHALAGRSVVRLKGGDPFVFGRGSEEAIYLHERGIGCEIVPGIPAAIACATYAGIPLTHRRVATAAVFVTGHESTDKPQPQLDYDALAKLGADGATLCIYMGMFRLAEIADELIARGMEPTTPAAVVRWGTLPKQRSIRTTLQHLAADVDAAGLKAPAMIYIGPVVGVDGTHALDWFETRPLFGKTVLVTRTRAHVSQLSSLLCEAGVRAIEAPTIVIDEARDAGAIDGALRNISDYDWLVVTSANGVCAMYDRMFAIDLDIRGFSNVKIAAVGSSTAEALFWYGVRADLVPDKSIGTAIADVLIADHDVAGKKILMLRADIAGADLPTMLTDAGAIVDDIAVYENRPAEALPDEAIDALRAGEVDWLTFTSSSTVKNLVALLGDDRSLLDGIKIASIGPKTSETCIELGLTVTCEANPRTMAGLVAAIVGHA